MHTTNIRYAGKKLHEADKALILIHGRGGSAEDILSLASHLNVQDYALLAPQATNNTWYPYSFLAPPQQNEPGLSSALEVLQGMVTDIKGNNIPSEKIFFAGFSQGACLTLEFTARNAEKFGGVAAFTGGLIGDKINSDHYNGDFEGTPVFIGTGDPDPHVPVERVRETARIFKQMNASMTVEVYDNRPHTISQDEIEIANRLMFK